jgi:cytidylate kinase
VDSSRDVSPLKPAADAIIIQTDNLSLDDVVERVIGLV